MKILVFGGSSGIGLAVALRAAKDNHDIVICSRDASKLEKATAEIRAVSGGLVMFKQLDLSDLKSLNTKLDEIQNDFGVPSAILLNGGGPLFAAFKDISISQWQQSTDQLIMANVMILNKFLPLMDAGGSVVGILSDVVRNAGAGKVLPCSLRMALLGILKCLSYEYADKQIRLNAISPGPVETQRAVGLLEKSAEAQGISFDEMRQKFVNGLPLKRMGQPQEIAELAYFMLSKGSSYMTGTNIMCDGGVTGMPI